MKTRDLEIAMMEAPVASARVSEWWGKRAVMMSSCLAFSFSSLLFVLVVFDVLVDLQSFSFHFTSTFLACSSFIYFTQIESPPNS